MHEMYRVGNGSTGSNSNLNGEHSGASVHDWTGCMPA